MKVRTLLPRALLSYEQFRCGQTFESVRTELQGEAIAARASGDRMYVTRRTVLGRMRQYKLAAYDYYRRHHGEKEGGPGNADRGRS